MLSKALYGLYASGNSFSKHLSDTLCSLGFKKSKMDYAMWYRKREDWPEYNYFSHHIHDFLLNRFNLHKTLDNLKNTYTITGGTMPKHHLRMSIERNDEGNNINLGSHEYVREVINKIKNLLGITRLKKSITPMWGIWTSASAKKGDAFKSTLSIMC